MISELRVQIGGANDHNFVYINNHQIYTIIRLNFIDIAHK